MCSASALLVQNARRQKSWKAEFSMLPEQDPDVTNGPGRARAPHASASCHPRDLTEKSSTRYEESYLLDVESGGGTGDKGSNGELHIDKYYLVWDIDLKSNNSC